ncbi:MAG: ATP-binding domain-containing protein [Dermatophilaceae bacterium]
MRENRGELVLRRVAGADVTTAVVADVQEASAKLGSIGVICADADVAGLAAALGGAGIRHTVLGGHASATEAGRGRDEAERVAIVPAVEAKGLEFDRVIVVEPAAIAETEADHRTGLRRLYVVLTRAVSALTVVHARPLPVELAGPRSGESSAELA